MHISDGVLSIPVLIGGYAAAVGIVAASTREMDPREIPRVAVITSVFFVASLIHVPIGHTSVHLILNGLVGIILGPMAFVSIFLGLVMQALLFQHGGITTIGVNALMMGIPALLSYRIFNLNKKIKFKYSASIFGAIAGGSSIFLSAVILAILLFSAGSEFIRVAQLALFAHMPVIIIEGTICGFIVSFLTKVKPEILFFCAKPLN
ncbi:MAG: cobalt transporter CbiM [Thermodesulfobacteriota bacterium]|nr:cobalt transporter CbiM [Thermodesulfobacteriota bacterium]